MPGQAARSPVTMRVATGGASGRWSSTLPVARSITIAPFAQIATSQTPTAAAICPTIRNGRPVVMTISIPRA